MRNLNTEILNANISILMEKHKTTQSVLASEIGMTQSNFSRAINNKKNQRFTLEQAYNIALYYNVSVDYLLGLDKPVSSKSERGICSLLTSLLEDRKIINFSTTREDEAIIPFSMFDGIPDVVNEKKKTSYNAFLFPNYLSPGSLDRFSENQIDDMRSEVYCTGNHDESNQRINDFFEKYFKIYDMYLHGQMEEDLFHEITNKFLEDLQ